VIGNLKPAGSVLVIEGPSSISTTKTFVTDMPAVYLEYIYILHVNQARSLMNWSNSINNFN
jgi:hypothetical protein